MLGIIPSIAFGQTIGAYISPTEFREFMPYNLGVTDASLDPLSPSQGIHGAKYQWGEKVPSISQVYDQANSGVIPGWNTTTTTPAPDNSWMDGTKTANDPCPAGFRVPTQNEWLGVINNNSKTYVGAWTNDAANYDSGIKLGNTLFLPSAGRRRTPRPFSGGALENRGSNGYYWSTTGSGESQALYFANNSAIVGGNWNRTHGFSVRCIKEVSTLSTQDINKNKGLGISLYPNPANSEFSITHAGASKKV